MDFLCHSHKTDMPRARIRSFNYREKTPMLMLMHVHHEGLRSYAAWSSKLNIDDITLKSHTNHSVKQLSKFAK